MFKYSIITLLFLYISHRVRWKNTDNKNNFISLKVFEILVVYLHHGWTKINQGLRRRIFILRTQLCYIL